tara:strand:- start:770 stop:1081 length:312 start_codon:yes stop_codon:yes gene_type:complete
MSNLEVRNWYKKKLASIPLLIDSRVPLREQGLESHALRTKFKLQARDLMSDREAAEKLPPPEKLKESVRKAYKDYGLAGDEVWKRIIYGAQKSNKEVDSKLGL